MKSNLVDSVDLETVAEITGMDPEMIKVAIKARKETAKAKVKAKKDAIKAEIEGNLFATVKEVTTNNKISGFSAIRDFTELALVRIVLDVDREALSPEVQKIVKDASSAKGLDEQFRYPGAAYSTSFPASTRTSSGRAGEVGSC